jgi:hypothetical protein
MNRSAILILMVVALVLAGILIFLKKDQSTPRPRSPFEDINTVSANRIRCERRDQSAWTLEFREGRWMIDEHGATPPTRAEAANVQKILGFLRDIRPTEWLDMDDRLIDEAGLSQPRVRLSVRDDVHESVLEFGDTDIHDLVAVRRPGEKRVFKVDSPLVDTLSQDARLLRETRLVAFEANSIARIRIEHHTQTKIEIERVGQRWYGRHENGLWRADRQMCDTLELTVTQIRVVGRLRRVRAHLDKDEAFCFTYGDGVGNIDVSAAIAFHRQRQVSATVTAVTPPGRFGALELADERVVAFCEKPRGDGGWINGGFFVLNPSVFDLIDGDACIWEAAPVERLAQTGQLAAWRHDGFWQGMDTLRDKDHLENLWASGTAPWKNW